MVVSPTVSRTRSAPQRAAVRRRLRALESALRAVDVTHWPPPRIEPRSSAVDVATAASRPLRALGPDDVDLRVHHAPVAARCRPPPARAGGSPPRAQRRPASPGRGAARDRPRRGDRRCPRRAGRSNDVGGVASKLPAATCALSRSVRSARRMSIRPWRTRRRREIASSPSSICASSADNSSSESDCRSGSVSTVAFPVGRARWSKLQRSEGVNLSLRLCPSS